VGVGPVCRWECVEVCLLFFFFPCFGAFYFYFFFPLFFYFFLGFRVQDNGEVMSLICSGVAVV